MAGDRAEVGHVDARVAGEGKTRAGYARAGSGILAGILGYHRLLEGDNLLKAN